MITPAADGCKPKLGSVVNVWSHKLHVESVWIGDVEASPTGWVVRRSAEIRLIDRDNAVCLQLLSDDVFVKAFQAYAHVIDLPRGTEITQGQIASLREVQPH